MKTFDVEAVQANAAVALSYLLGHTYRHYKGGLYRVVTTAVDEATGNVLVIYYSIDKTFTWSRTYENFAELVEVDGKKVARFERVER